MPSKKRVNPDSTKNALPSKRAKSLPGFRVCPPVESPSSQSGSRVTTLKKVKGRTGQRKEDRVQQQTESPHDDTLLPGQESQPALETGPTLAFDPSFSSVDSPSPATTSSKPRRERNNKNAVSSFLSNASALISSQTKLTEWIGYRDSCLDELLRQDGHGDFLGNSACSSCSEGEGVYKCRDCLTGCRLRCSACMVSAHLDHPLHCIEVCYSVFIFLDATNDLSL